MTEMRVHLRGTHYYGILVWMGPNQVRAGVRWDGFTGVEDCAVNDLEMWLA